MIVEYFQNFKKEQRRCLHSVFEVKYLADSASASSKVKHTLRYDNVILISWNGRRFQIRRV